MLPIEGAKGFDIDAFRSRKLPTPLEERVAERPPVSHIEWNPNTGKYELVNAYGLDSGDLAKFGTMGAFVIPEVLATTFAAGTVGPTGAVLTSGFSSAFLEASRLALGNELYGINKSEKGFEDYLANEGKDIGALNAILTTGGFTIPKLYRMVKDLRR